MPLIPTKTTYLQMFEPPTGDPPPVPRHDLAIRRVDRPSCDVYRQLYRSVGSQWSWVDRLVMPEEQLSSILQDDRVDVFLLCVAGQPAGYAELDRRIKTEIELAYFGLFPSVLGQGIGKHFLDWTLRAAWSYRPTRVWVHTCDLDHPAALPTYLKAGFQIYDEKIVAQFVPDERGSDDLSANR
jgi:GNAT superfamily N-acetyltransferase